MLEIDPRYPNLRMLDLTEQADAKRLLFLLAGDYKLESDEFPNYQEPKLRLPGGMISRLLLSGESQSLGAKSALIESDYIDRDTNIAYAQLYARAFRDFPRRTIRLHFFRKKIISYDDLMDEDSLQDSYIGSCVLSLINAGGIGKTILPPPKYEKQSIFTPTLTEFHINVGGAEIKPRGTAFVEQDRRVAACATAATWMSTSITARRFGFDMLIRSMPEITSLATKYSLPPLGRGSSPGLKIEQMLWALQEMNYEPLAYEVYSTDKGTELIHNFVESGIPPILVISYPNRTYHAITVVGYSYDPNYFQKVEQVDDAYFASSMCPYFFIHDDQMGPYLKIKLGQEKLDEEGNLRPSIIFDESDTLLGPFKEDVADWYSNALLCHIIAPFPPRHMLRPEDAKLKALEIFLKVFKIFSYPLSIQLPKPVILRTYFIASNDFKKRLSKAVDFLPKFFHWYRGTVYPRYIWVTELCEVDKNNSNGYQEPMIIADVAIDPTSSPRSQDFVSLRIPHLFFRMSPGDTDINATLRLPCCYIQDDGPYIPLSYWNQLNLR